MSYRSSSIFVPTKMPVMLELVFERPLFSRVSQERFAAGSGAVTLGLPGSAGVRLNVTTKGEAFIVYQALLDNARQRRSDAAIEGVLVSPMAKKGVEIIIGTMWDATFGPMVMVGFGGITIKELPAESLAPPMTAALHRR